MQQSKLHNAVTGGVRTSLVFNVTALGECSVENIGEVIILKLQDSHQLMEHVFLHPWCVLGNSTDY